MRRSGRSSMRATAEGIRGRNIIRKPFIDNDLMLKLLAVAGTGEPAMEKKFQKGVDPAGPHW